VTADPPTAGSRPRERTVARSLVEADIKKLGKFNRIGHGITGDRTGQSNTRGVGWEYLHLAVDGSRASPIPRFCPRPLPALSRRRCASFEASASTKTS
jgi:hypothetical protein